MGIGEDIMLSYCLDCDHLGRDHHPLDGCKIEDCECSIFTLNQRKKPHKPGVPDEVSDDI